MNFYDFFCRLKQRQEKSDIVARLIDSWLELQNNDQAVFAESVEQLFVNSDVGSVTLQLLRKSVEKLSSSVNCSKIHSMVLVNNKLLSLYSR